MSESKFRLRKEYLATYFIAELPPEGLPARFGVITSYNPNGGMSTVAENRAADLKRKQCLGQLGLRHFRVTGMSKIEGIKNRASESWLMIVPYWKN